MRKFHIFQFFFTQMTVNNFLKQHKSTQFDMAFEWCINYHYFKNSSFFTLFGKGLKLTNFFLSIYHFLPISDDFFLNSRNSEKPNFYGHPQKYFKFI
jgi:hypothetical protein